MHARSLLLLIADGIQRGAQINSIFLVGDDVIVDPPDSDRDAALIEKVHGVNTRSSDLVQVLKKKKKPGKNDGVLK